MLKPSSFFDLSGNPYEDLFGGAEYVWEPLKKLDDYIKSIIKPNVLAMSKGGSLVEKTVILHDGKVLDADFTIDTSGKKPVVKKVGQILDGASIIFAGAYLWDDEIEIGKNVIIEPGALIKGPTIIGDGTEVRQGAYIRGNVLVGHDCVVGHATEIKSSVLLGGSKAGHFAYIGDSILGKVNLGAGTKLANLKLIGSPITLNIDGKKYETGLRKFGAILADGVETGCNSVTMPGTLLGKDVLLYPNATVRGYCPPKTIVKSKQTNELQERK